MNIRRAQQKDLKRVAEIYNEFLGKATMDLKPLSEKAFEKYVDASDEALFVACEEDEIIGWSLIKRYSPKEGYAKSCETSTYITKALMGKGYGSDLKKFIMNECQKMGFTHIVAKIISDNKSSIAYNLKLGYEIVGEQKNVGFIDGKYKNVTILQYNFKSK